MKKLLILTLLCLFCLPCIAREYKYTPEGFIDDTEYQQYYNKLRQEYFAKVYNGELDCNGANFAKYVLIPLEDFRQEKEKIYKY